MEFKSVEGGNNIMENHFCTLHGCQMEEREDPKGSHRIGQRTFVCLVCEEEGRGKQSIT